MLLGMMISLFLFKNSIPINLNNQFGLTIKSQNDYSNNNYVDSENSYHYEKSDSESFRGSLKIFGLIILLLTIITIVTAVLHKKEVLTVYSDYTDVTFTALSIILPLLFMLIFYLLKFDTTTNYIICGIIALILLFIVALKTVYNNYGNVLFVILVFITKYFITIFYLLILILINLRFQTRRKDESKYQFESRVSRENEQDKIREKETIANYVSTSRFLTRHSSWSSVSNYFNKKQYLTK